MAKKAEPKEHPTNENSPSKKKFKHVYVYILISLGIILILLTILCDMAIKKTVPAESTSEFTRKICIHLVSHIGIGLFVIGIVAIVLDFNHWTRYFEERLTGIVVGKGYLEKLDPNQLINLQTDVLRAYYKNPDLGGAEGFLSYYQKNIQSMVILPFRHNTKLDFEIEQVHGQPDQLSVAETISWTCVGNGGAIQSSISWLPDKGEFLEIVEKEVRIQHPELKTITNPNGTITFKNDQLPKPLNDPESLGFELQLTPEQKLEGLQVTIRTKTKIVNSRFLAWRMASPTRGAMLSVRYPKSMMIVTELFISDQNNHQIIDEEGKFDLRTQDWLLPNQGITLQVLEKPVTPPDPVVQN